MPHTEKSFDPDAFSIEVDLNEVDEQLHEDEESTVQMRAPTLLNDIDLNGFGQAGGTTGARPLVDLMGETRIRHEGDLAPTTIRPLEEPEKNLPMLVVDSNERTLEVPVLRSPLVVGRAMDCDLVLSDELVSRRHASIEQRPDGWYVKDQESLTKWVLQ